MKLRETRDGNCLHEGGIQRRGGQRAEHGLKVGRLLEQGG